MRLVLFFVLTMGLVSCSDIFPAKKTGFRVKAIEVRDVEYAHYFVSSIDGEVAFFIDDTSGKYNVGDTLVLTKK